MFRSVSQPMKIILKKRHFIFLMGPSEYYDRVKNKHVCVTVHRRIRLSNIKIKIQNFTLSQQQLVICYQTKKKYRSQRGKISLDVVEAV